MSTIVHPSTTVAFQAWLEEQAEDARPTHRVRVDMALEFDIAVPPWIKEREVQLAVLAAISRFDRSVVLERIDYELDRFLPGEVRLVGSSASVVPA